VLANRLSASGQHSVLLLEAGPKDRNPWIHIPIGYAKLFSDPKVNWLYNGNSAVPGGPLMTVCRTSSAPKIMSMAEMNGMAAVARWRSQKRGTGIR